jgi:hypothetical protein
MKERMKQKNVEDSGTGMLSAQEIDAKTELALGSSDQWLDDDPVVLSNPPGSGFVSPTGTTTTASDALVTLDGDFTANKPPIPTPTPLSARSQYRTPGVLEVSPFYVQVRPYPASNRGPQGLFRLFFQDKELCAIAPGSTLAFYEQVWEERDLVLRTLRDWADTLPIRQLVHSMTDNMGYLEEDPVPTFQEAALAEQVENLNRKMSEVPIGRSTRQQQQQQQQQQKEGRARDRTPYAPAASGNKTDTSLVSLYAPPLREVYPEPISLDPVDIAVLTDEEVLSTQFFSTFWPSFLPCYLVESFLSLPLLFPFLHAWY